MKYIKIENKSNYLNTFNFGLTTYLLFFLLFSSNYFLRFDKI